MAQPGFQVEEIPDNVVQHPSLVDRAMITGVTLGLKALSQGAAIAIANMASHLFSLITVAMVFWIWSSIPDPNNYQLISLALFGLFILAANVIVRRK